MPDYPATLPAPDWGTYVGATDFGINATAVDSAQGSQQKTFNSPRVDLVMTFTMAAAKLLEWTLWAESNAWDWFNMQVVSPHRPVLVTSAHRLRFSTEGTSAKVGHDLYAITVGAELWPGDPDDPLVDDARVWDWIIAGTPPAPAAPMIYAGTPADPAEPQIKPSFYAG